ncbi:MAG: sulfur carrier protein ThiS [Acidobacteriota bacterium]
MIRFTLNGESREVPGQFDLESLLKHFGLPSQRVAIELNGTVVRRADWANARVTDGDKIEVVHFVGGG